jgi:integrase
VALFKWLEEDGEIPVSPMARMKPPTVPEVPVPVLGVEEVKRLLAACRGKDFDNVRDEAVLRLFIDTGMRLKRIAVRPSRCELGSAARATMDAWRDLQPARRLQKRPGLSAISWPRLTPGRLTPMTRRRGHSDVSWREPRQRGRRRRGAVRRVRSRNDDPLPDLRPVRTLGIYRLAGR